MIRWTVFYFVLATVLAVGFRRWFLAACALIVLSALHDHAYFKEPIAGIGGLKHYNILVMASLGYWLLQRRSEGLVWDAPRSMSAWLGLYVLVVLYTGGLAIMDFDALARTGQYTVASFVMDDILNPLKFVVPAVLLFDGCRRRDRFELALVAMTALALITAVYIIKIIPVGSLRDADAVLKYRDRIDKLLGLHPNDVALILVPGFWAAVSQVRLRHVPWQRVACWGAAGVMVIALLLTQSRTGMVTFLGVGIVLGLRRYRAFTLVLMLLAPIAYVGLASIAANWSRGMAVQSADGSVATDWNEVSNGRIELWQIALEDIQLSPLLGQGRLFQLRQPYGPVGLISHPHNAYLDVWLEGGIFALAAVLVIFGVMLLRSWRMMGRGRTELEDAVGACAFASVLTHFIAGFAGNAFVPRLSSVLSLCAMGLACRMYVARRRQQHLAAMSPIFDPLSPDPLGAGRVS